ncbi:MAG: RHS repeat-associated core domain-containing protein [Kiritimatiellia bacterium]
MAEYTYDAFGRTIAATGSMADTFRHRFSTKYYETETGLYYYGYRFYAPKLMRWLNRDPIDEEGGLNLYGFCGNDSVNRLDAMGMATVKVYAWKPTTLWEKIKGEGNYNMVEIHSAEEVPVEYGKFSGNTWGAFDDNHLVVAACDCADSIDIFPTIIIRAGLPKQGVPGAKYLFRRHQACGGEVTSGGGYVLPSGQLIEGSVLAHERGHAQAFFELVLPRFRKAVENHFPGKLKSKDTKEVRRLFLQARKDTMKEHIEMVFKREFEWYRRNGFTITEPASPGGFYEATPLASHRLAEITPAFPHWKSAHALKTGASGRIEKKG